MDDGQDQNARRLLFIHDRHQASELTQKGLLPRWAPTQVRKAFET